MRFLKHMDPGKYVDGLKEQLTDTQIGMAFYLSSDIPPWYKLREMRGRTLGVLKFGCISVTVGLWDSGIQDL